MDISILDHSLIDIQSYNMTNILFWGGFIFKKKKDRTKDLYIYTKKGKRDTKIIIRRPYRYTKRCANTPRTMIDGFELQILLLTLLQLAPPWTFMGPNRQTNE